MRLELEQIALPELVRDILQRSFPSARVQFTAEATIPAVVVDPVQIGEVLAILLARALRASSASVSIEVSQRGQEVLFAVRDQASPAASAGDRFFERAGPAIFLAKIIAEVHGGRTRIESAPGQGNTTTVALPSVGAERPIVRGAGAGSHGSTTRGRSRSRDGRSPRPGPRRQRLGFFLLGLETASSGSIARHSPRSALPGFRCDRSCASDWRPIDRYPASCTRRTQRTSWHRRHCQLALHRSS